MAETLPENGPAQVAANAIAAAAQAITQVTAPGHVDVEQLPPVKFDRLSVERRVLGHITDEVNVPALGSRNTLAALTYDLMGDRNTTHPPAPNGRLEVDGLTVEQIAGSVLRILSSLIGAGLVAVREDGSYALTDAGHTELAS